MLGNGTTCAGKQGDILCLLCYVCHMMPSLLPTNLDSIKQPKHELIRYCCSFCRVFLNQISPKRLYHTWSFIGSCGVCSNIILFSKSLQITASTNCPKCEGDFIQSWRSHASLRKTQQGYKLVCWIETRCLLGADPAVCSLCISATDNCSQCFKKKKTLPAKLHRSCVSMHACVYRAQKISISQQANIHELNNLQLLHSKSLPAAAPLVKKRLDFWLVSLIKMNLLSIFVHSGDVSLWLVGEDRCVGAWQYFKLQQ